MGMFCRCSYVLVFIFTFTSILAYPALQPSRTGYNETEARQLLNLAAGAYGITPQGCINQTFGDDAHLYTVYTSNNLVCDFLKDSCASYTLVNEHERRIYVIFRGTKTKKQLLLEGWTSLFPKSDFYGAGLVNKYFASALDILWPHVHPVFTDPRYTDYDVTFTGHSLGGALAALGALKAVLDDHRNGSKIRLITFGEPRVGNSQLASKFDELLPHSYRVVHADDIVPHLPACAKDELDPRVHHEEDDSKPCDPKDLSKSYHHGIEIWYPTGMGPNSTYYECLGTPKNEDFDCSDSLSFELTKYNKYIFSHRHYFEHKVPPFGKLGCQENKQPLEEQMSIDAEEPLGASNSASSNGFSVTGAWNAIRQKLASFGK